MSLETENQRLMAQVERAGALVDREDAQQRLFAVQPSLDVNYVSGWLRRIVGEDDERHALLADLITCFGGSSPP